MSAKIHFRNSVLRLSIQHGGCTYIFGIVRHYPPPISNYLKSVRFVLYPFIFYENIWAQGRALGPMGPCPGPAAIKSTRSVAAPGPDIAQTPT